MSETPEIFSLPHARPEVTKFLKTRRSNLAKLMQEPGPSDAHIQEMLGIAARVPDHRKLAPWRFILFQGQARQAFGAHLSAAFQKDYPELPEDRAIFEASRLMRAPLVIAVVSSPKACPRGTPKWEQELSAGAVCYNLCLAAQSYGFAAQWLTEWYAYHDDVARAMKLDAAERIAGFIYIGSTDTPPTERVRPNLSELITDWS